MRNIAWSRAWVFPLFAVLAATAAGACGDDAALRQPADASVTDRFFIADAGGDGGADAGAALAATVTWTHSNQTQCNVTPANALVVFSVEHNGEGTVTISGEIERCSPSTTGQFNEEDEQLMCDESGDPPTGMVTVTADNGTVTVPVTIERCTDGMASSS